MSDIDAGERKPPALPPKPIRASASDEAEPRTATPEPGSQPPVVPPKPDRSRLPPELPPKPKTKEAGKRPLSEYNVKHIVKLQALIRRHLCIVKWRQYAKMIAKRTNVAKEILSTEKQYVQNLRNLVAGFLQPLRENAKSAAPLITEENLKGVFSDIEVILGYHSLLEKELEKRISAWSQSVKLGDIFLKIASFLKTYNQYIQHYKKANLLLIDLNKNPEFAAMMEKLRFSPVCGGKGIKDFLIMPVQRIPRYSMLLQDMVKNTWSHHGDYAALSQALKTILELASYVEEQQGENANVIKVLEVQNMLSGKVMDGTKLVQPSRRYVREAAATKHERDGKQSPVHLFLFNDILIWSKPKKADTHEVIKLDSLITLIVKDAEIGLLDAPTHVRAFGIVTPQGASTVILASADEKRLWQTDLRKFIKESNDKYNAVKKREGGDLGNDDINDILNFQKVTVTAVHGTKKEEGSAIAREMGAFSGKIRNGFSSVLSRASGGSTRKDEDEARSTPAKPGSSPRGNRPGSLINVSTTKEPATPVRSPRSATITASSSVGVLQTPPRLANSGRSLSAATTTTPSKSTDLPSPTPQRSTTDNASTTASAGPALLPTPAPPTSAPPPESPKGERMEPSPRRDKKEKKERTRRGTLDTADVSPRKERARPSRKDASERPAGYGTLRSPQTSTPAASVAPSAATTDSIPQASPRTPLSLDVDTQTKLARLKDENEEAARRLKKMQEKFGAVVEQK